MTLAQFLLKRSRYDVATGQYRRNPNASKHDGEATVIIDEASMLTEDQLAATLDALKGPARIILVGDDRQLPPIGAGRPFADIIRHLREQGHGLAELTVSRRQIEHLRQPRLRRAW